MNEFIEKIKSNPLLLKIAITFTIASNISVSFALFVVSLALFWPWYFSVALFCWFVCSIAIPASLDKELTHMLEKSRRYV